MPKLYLAGSLFTLAERNFNTGFARMLEECGLEVWLPQEHEPREKTAKAIFLEDVKGIDWSDIVVACMDGPDPDSGTSWECGYAYAKGKPIIMYRTDFRNAEDFPGSRYNLMLSQSATRTIDLDAIMSTTRDLARCIELACYEQRADQFGGFDRPLNGERYRHCDK